MKIVFSVENRLTLTENDEKKSQKNKKSADKNPRSASLSLYDFRILPVFP